MKMDMTAKPEGEDMEKTNEGEYSQEQLEEMLESFLQAKKIEADQKLFNTLIENFPSTWTPDVKALKDAITESGIIPLTNPEDQNHCQACQTSWTGTGICPNCGYRPDTDGTPEEHRKWYDSWKAGKEPRFDVGSILTSIISKNNLTEQSKKV